MASTAQRIENPVTGQVMIIHATGAETNGEVFRAEGIFRPGGFAGAPHVHPLQEERFEVTRGIARFQVGRKQVRLGPGEALVLPAGQVHTFWNAGPEEMRVMMEFRPDLPSTARFYRFYFGLARAGKARKNGLPSIWQIALQAEEFADHVRLASPPWWLQRAVFAVLRPIARLLGYRPWEPPA
jgi:quercetin dioxygenase-like cupin family protein